MSAMNPPESSRKETYGKFLKGNLWKVLERKPSKVLESMEIENEGINKKGAYLIGYIKQVRIKSVRQVRKRERSNSWRKSKISVFILSLYLGYLSMKEI